MNKKLFVFLGAITVFYANAGLRDRLIDYYNAKIAENENAYAIEHEELRYMLANCKDPWQRRELVDDLREACVQYTVSKMVCMASLERIEEMPEM